VDEFGDPPSVSPDTDISLINTLCRFTVSQCQPQNIPAFHQLETAANPGGDKHGVFTAHENNLQACIHGRTVTSHCNTSTFCGYIHDNTRNNCKVEVKPLKHKETKH